MYQLTTDDTDSMPTSPLFYVIVFLIMSAIIAVTPVQALALESIHTDENTPDVVFGQAKVVMAGQTYTLEFANNDTQRARGLMYRTELCNDCGMLFDFGQSRPVGMWMKNTNIALDVAYLDATGEIINIEPMQPRSLQSHYSKGPVKFAIEMNLGWFAMHDLQAGDKVRLISAMPKN
jgi:uncharacterized membrane protein (UPF0127 family)